MAVRRFSAYNSVDTNLVTTAETVVATLSGVSTNGPGQTIGLRGRATITLGAGTTGVTLRFRQNDINGSSVGEANTEQISTAAGSTEDHDIYREDTGRGEFSGGTYVLTVQQVGATGNGTCLNASLDAEITP